MAASEIYLLLVGFLSSTQAASTFRAFYGENFLNYFHYERANPFLIDKILQNLHPPSVSDPCLNDLKILKNASESEEWALEMLDSSGSYQSGLFSGNVINLGTFDECSGIQAPSFSTAYCLVTVTVEGTPQNSSFVPHNAPIIHSLCLPANCSESDISSLLKNEAGEKISMEVSCSANGSSLLTHLPAVIFFFSLWMVISASTIYDVYYPKPRGNLWNSFSLLMNGKVLLRTAKGPNNFGCVHGIRFLSQVLVIWYHYFLNSMSKTLPVTNKFYFNEFVRSWKGAWILCFTLAVDSYLVLSGFLLTFNFLKKNQQGFGLWSHYGHRYVRTVPVLLVTVMIYSSFIEDLCKGPLCNSILGQEMANCQSYWWATLAYINNLWPGFRKSCLPHSWYLSADWQLYCISPILLISFVKLPKWKFPILGSVLGVSIILAFSFTFFLELKTDTILYSNLRDYDNYYNYFYTQPWTRAGPWIVGCMLGVLIHNFKNRPFHLSRGVTLVLWASCFILMVICFESNIPLQRSYSAVGAAFYNSIQKNIWALSVAWVIFACNAGWGGFVNTFLSWSGFQPLAKLSYSAYVIHKLVISLYIGNLRSPVYFSENSQTVEIAGIILISYGAAALIYLSVEGPFCQLDKLLMSEVAGRKAARATGNEPPIALNEGTSTSELSQA